MIIVTAYSAFNAEACRLTGLYYDSLNLAQNGSGITSTFFSDGSSSIDFEVCFVAGTPILLADGTSKPIEKIQSGDMVLAADHEHPNSTPKPCRVTRVFHNAPQATWKLTLADGQTIQCTKEHLFYVIGRGWTSAEDLGIGDHLLRPDGSTISLSAKEYVETVQPVFNFEVENAHTYFVGETCNTSVLVHNWCMSCDDLVWPWDSRASWNPWANFEAYARITQKVAPVVADKTLGVVQVPLEFVAGGADNLTFGVAKYARNSMWDEELTKIQNPNAYRAGEYAEMMTEILVSGGSATLKNGAKVAIKKEIAKQGTGVLAEKIACKNISRAAKKFLQT